MKNKKIVFLIGIFTLLISMVFVYIRVLPSKTVEDQKNKKQIVRTVEIVKAKNGNIAMMLDSTGSVTPDTLVTVVSQVEGELTLFPFKEGDNVKKGQLLAQIATEDIQAQIKQAEADLEYATARLKAISAGARPQEIGQAEAQVRQMQASLGAAQKDLQYTKDLYLGPIPRQQLDNAEGKYKSALAQLESVKVKLNNAEKELKRTRQLFDLGAVSEENVEQAETNYNALLAQLQAVEAEVESSNANLKNTKELYDLDAIPRQMIDNAEAKFFVATSQLQSAQEKLNLLKAGPIPEDIEVAKTQVKQAEAKLDYMKVKLHYYTIKAPINGIVTERFVEQGDVVASKQKLLTIADISHVLIMSSISELDISKVKRGMMVSVSVDAYPQAQFSGSVTRIHPITEGKARSIPVEIRLPNPDGKLLPGMFSRITFIVDKHENAILLPKDAIVTEGEKTVAFVVKDSQIHITPIQTGIKQENMVEIKNGIVSGDKVVITGQSELKDGMQVKITENQELDKKKGNLVSGKIGKGIE